MAAHGVDPLFLAVFLERALGCPLHEKRRPLNFINLDQLITGVGHRVTSLSSFNKEFMEIFHLSPLLEQVDNKIFFQASCLRYLIMVLNHNMIRLLELIRVHRRQNLVLILQVLHLRIVAEHHSFDF